MEKAMIPTPEQRPDLYDDYDCQDVKPLSPEYRKTALSPTLQKMLAERQKAKQPAKPEDKSE
jgi:hypothetical protein